MNRYEVAAHEVVPPLIFILILGLAIWFGSNLFIKNKEKASLLTSLFFVMLFSYAHFAGFFALQDTLFFPAYIVVFSLIGYLIFKCGRNMHNVTTLANAIAIVFFGIITVAMVWNAAVEPPYTLDNLQARPISLTQNDSNPDVYYIILDGFSRSDTLQSIFGWNNSKFISHLESKGFFVAKDSRANYPVTFQSLGSSLTMEHIHAVVELQGKESRDKRLLYEIIRDNRVARIFKDAGYKYIHVGSGWSPTEYSTLADININHYQLPIPFFNKEFTRKFISTTAFYTLLSFFGISDEEAHRQRVFHNFEAIKHIKNLEGPKFVFAHFIVPHEPYVFNPDGTRPTDQEVQDRGDRINYINQVRFVEAQVIDLIDSLLTGGYEPIIILQADHGSAITSSGNRVEGGRAYSYTAQSIRERMRIFNAYYFPNNRTSNLYHSITPVNTFRVLFNEFFGTFLTLRNDDSYVHASPLAIYDLLNATMIVDGKEKQETAKYSSVS